MRTEELLSTLEAVLTELYAVHHAGRPSQAQAVAIVDRLVDQATILRFSGKPFRQPRDVHGASLEGE